MAIEQRTQDDVTILSLTPQVITDVSVDLFKLTIESLLARGARSLVLDMGELRWLNSYGLGLLVGAHRSDGELGGRIVLIRVNDRIHELLEVMGVLPLWELQPDEQSALATFAE